MKSFFEFNAMILLMSFNVGAANNNGPSLNAKCNFDLQFPLNGNEVKFNEACTEIYVLPPDTGMAEIVSLARTANLSFCSRLDDVNAISDSIFRSLKVMTVRVENMIRDFDPLDQDLITERKKSSQTRAKMTSAQSRLVEAEEQLDYLRTAVRSENQAYQECLDENIDRPNACDRQKSKFDEAKILFDSFRLGEYRETKREANRLQEEYNAIFDTIVEIQKRYTDAIGPLLELKKTILELNNEVMTLYRDYANLEGAAGQILWSIGWNDLVAAFRNINPGLRVTWSRMPLTEAQLTSTVRLPSDNLSTNMAAIKSALIPGGKVSGFAGMGNGGKIGGAAMEPRSPSEASIAFGDSVSGQIVLSLLGACPYLKNGETNTIDSDQLTAHMTANLVYSYEIAARREYTARYNLSNLLRKIESKMQRGGFFSTEAAHAIAEDGYAGDWFSINFDSNSSEFQYSSADQTALAVTIKRELIDRAMKQFAVFNAGAATPGQVPNFVESGAYRSSAELRKCLHGYCQVASVVLGVADSIWGRSDATAAFHRNNNVWVSDRVRGRQFVERSGSLSFSPTSDTVQ